MDSTIGASYVSLDANDTTKLEFCYDGNIRALPYHENKKLAIDDFCLLYTSDAADEEDSVDLGGRRIIKKKKNKETQRTKKKTNKKKEQKKETI